MEAPIEHRMLDVVSEIGEVANALEVDLEKELETVLKKYERRLQKGSAGSENE
jgi:NTP pyrophosphatase (non-canonical NTP hydrolase)